MLKKNKLALFSLVASMGATLMGCGPVEPTYYSVAFYVDDVQYGEVQSVEENGLATKPATDPTKAEDLDYTYQFEGWFAPGATEAFDFNTPITSDIDFDAHFSSVKKTYDLTVWVWGGKADAVYITEAENNAVKAAASNLSALQGKKLDWRYHVGMEKNDFVQLALDAPIKPDLIIAGANVYSDSTEGGKTIACDTHTNAGAGWFNNSKRYVMITNTAGSHEELATEVYNLVAAYGPDYFKLNAGSLTMVVEDTATLSATDKDDNPVVVNYSVADEYKDIIEVNASGVVTAKAEGNAEVVATRGVYSVVVPVEVSSVEYSLVVYVNATTSNSITEDENAAMKEAAERFLIDGEQIQWKYFTISEQSFVTTYHDAEIDLVISSSNLSGKSDGSWGEENKFTFNENGPKSKLGSGWCANTSRYTGIPAQVKAEHLDLAERVYGMLLSNGPSFETQISKTTLELQAGSSEQLNANAYGVVVWSIVTQSSPDVITLSDTGLVTANKAGEATVMAAGENGTYATCEVTVTEQEVVKPMLVVDVLSGTASKTYITEDDIATLRGIMDAELKLAGEEDVLYEIRLEEGMTGASFWTKVNTYADVDVIIAASNINEQTGKQEILEGSSLTKVTRGLTNDSRYTEVLARTPADHLKYAKMFARAITGFTVDATMSLAPQATQQINVSNDMFGETLTPTFASSKEEVATVSSTGLVTAVAEGTATITATVGTFEATTAVTVVTPTQEPIDLKICCTNRTSNITAEKLADLVKQVEACVSSNVTITWEYNDGKMQDFADYYHTLTGVDIVVAHNQSWSKATNPLPGTYTALGTGWAETSVSCSIVSELSGAKLAEANKIISLLTAAYVASEA